MAGSAFVCHERLAADTVLLGLSRLCQVRLMNDRTWPWVLLVPAVPGIREIYELAPDQRQRLMEESCLLGEAMMTGFRRRQTECRRARQHGTPAAFAPHCPPPRGPGLAGAGLGTAGACALRRTGAGPGAPVAGARHRTAGLIRVSRFFWPGSGTRPGSSSAQS